MNNKFLFLVSLLLSVNSLFSQENTANLWYFADHAGISFNTGIPIALTEGQTDIIEGCATLCDEDGSLLFYTDGMNVWNKNHQIMTNGTGLMGNPSATQSAIITPYPQNDSLFIIFTIDAGENYLQNGLRYSVINLNLNSGLGDITSDKNILLSSPVSEKLTAIIKNNQTDYWIIVHEWETNNFLSYSITSNGINTTPIISSIGAVHIGGNPHHLHSVGYMKSNINGDKIAVANYRNSGFFELFDFNKVTGTLSNVETSATNFFRPYGVEFSPSGNILYGSIDGEEYINGKVYQFDLTQANPLDNPILIGSSTSHTPGLQLGPNGKIYVSIKNYGYIGVIDEPEVLGVNCNFIHDAVYLEGKTAWRGFPSLFYYKGFQFFTGSEIDISICDGDSVFLENAYQKIAGTYYDTAQTSLGWDSIINTNLEVLPVAATPIITENSGILLSSSATHNQWYFNESLIAGATNQEYQPFISGTYKVIVNNNNGCSISSDEYSFVYVSVNELDVNFEVYPIPFSNELFVKCKKEFSVNIIDLKGNVIFSRSKMFGLENISLNNMNQGIYIIKIRTKDRLIVRKIVNK